VLRKEVWYQFKLPLRAGDPEMVNLFIPRCLA
jgi:hypothetical protein